MQTVNIELQPILSGVLQFVSYMVLAVFAENVVLARDFIIEGGKLRHFDEVAETLLPELCA